MHLTGKQTAFIEHYCGDCNYNGTEAASQAGYKGDRNQLDSIASENLQKPAIKTAIDVKRAKIAESMDVSRQEVIDNARWLVKFGQDNGRTTAVSQGNEQLGKVANVFSENTNVTDTQRRRELDEIETKEAKAIAKIRLSEFRNAV